MDTKREASAKKEDESAEDNPEGPTSPADQTNTPSNKRKLSTTEVISKRPNKELEDMNEGSRGPDAAHREKMVLRGKRSMPSDESTEQILNASTSSLKENIPALKVRKVKSRDNKDDMDDPESDAAVADKGNRPNKCTECQKSFVNSANLRSHYESHTGESLVQCHICYQLLSRRDCLRRHRKIKHPGSTSSPVGSKSQCSKIPAARSGHLICLFPSCGEEIPRKEMQNHVWGHEDVKPYKCSHCPKSFRTTFQLKLHTATHTGELVVQCPYCEQSCSKSSNLKIHLKLKHSAETGHSGTRSKANPKRTGLRKKNKRGINDANSSESEVDECSGNSSFDSSHVDQQLSTSSNVTPVRRVQRQCRGRDGISVVKRHLLKSFLPKNLDILDFSLPKEYFNGPDITLTESVEKPDNSQVLKDDHRVNVEFKSVSIYMGQGGAEQPFEIVVPVNVNHVSADHTQNHRQIDEKILMGPTNATEEDIDMDVDLCDKLSTEVLPADKIHDVSSSMDDINNNERAVESFADVKHEPDDGPNAVVEPYQKLQLCEGITSDISNIVHTVTEQNRIHDENVAAESHVAGVGIRDTVQDKEKTGNVDELKGVPDFGFILDNTCSADDVNNIVKTEEDDDLKPTVVPVRAKYVNETIKEQNRRNVENMAKVTRDAKLEENDVDADLLGEGNVHVESVSRDMAKNNSYKKGHSSQEIRNVVGTSQHFIELFAKSNVHTLYVVWQKDFNLDIARSVAANSSNTMLIVEKFDYRQFDLVRLFGSVVVDQIYVGDEIQKELHCFTFGKELSARDIMIFPNFEEVERELTNFASSHNKSLVHIVEKDWVHPLAETLKKQIIRF